jgi:hypothetical protein
MTALPVVKGWTLDARLHEFRRVDETNGGLLYAGFDTSLGQELLRPDRERDALKDMAVAVIAVDVLHGKDGARSNLWHATYYAIVPPNSESI